VHPATVSRLLAQQRHQGTAGEAGAAG
jgi:hypothetical protein